MFAKYRHIPVLFDTNYSALKFFFLVPTDLICHTFFLRIKKKTCYTKLLRINKITVLFLTPQIKNETNISICFLILK